MKVYAIIVLYNPTIELLEKEYFSLTKQVEKIIYIDNGSQNISLLENFFRDKENIVVEYLKKNTGIGNAQNVGIKYALREGVTHVILFDQDSIVEENFVKNLYESECLAIASGINVGLTGPIYYSYTNELYPIISIKDNEYIEISINSFDNYIKVSHIIASGELIRREVFDKIGLMNDQYFIEFVDYEYCFRASSCGFSTIVSKKASMHHLMGDNVVSFGKRKIGVYSPFRRYFACRNAMLVQKESVFPKVFKRHHLKLAIAKFIFSIIYGPSRMKQIKYCLRGFKDGYNGVYGNCTL